MIDTGLRTLLLAQSSITTLVPTQTINRNTIYPIFCTSVMQGVVPPFVLIKRLGGDPMLTLGLNGETLKTAVIEISSYSYSAVANETLDRTIRVFLDDQLEVAAGASDTLKAVLFDEPTAGYDSPVEGTDTRFYYCRTTYTVQYSTP